MGFEPFSSSDVKNVINMVHYRGNTFSRDVTILQEVGGVFQPEDLTGCSFIFSAVKVGDPSFTNVLSGSDATGEITFGGGPALGIINILFDNGTATIDAGDYKYDLTQTSPSGFVRTRVNGILTIKQNA